jgi:hypothetical protein
VAPRSARRRVPYGRWFPVREGRCGRWSGRRGSNSRPLPWQGTALFLYTGGAGNGLKASTYPQFPRGSTLITLGSTLIPRRSALITKRRNRPRRRWRRHRFVSERSIGLATVRLGAVSPPCPGGRPTLSQAPANRCPSGLLKRCRHASISAEAATSASIGITEYPCCRARKLSLVRAPGGSYCTACAA